LQGLALIGLKYPYLVKNQDQSIDFRQNFNTYSR